MLRSYTHLSNTTALSSPTEKSRLHGPFETPLEVVPECGRVPEEAHGTYGCGSLQASPASIRFPFGRRGTHRKKDHSPRAFASRRFSAARVAPGRLGWKRRLGGSERQGSAVQRGAPSRMGASFASNSASISARCSLARSRWTASWSFSDESSRSLTARSAWHF